MKEKNLLCQFLSALGGATITLSTATAADGTWNVDANGVWSAPGNWTPGIADGSGSTASFTNDITSDRTVSLDGDRTLTHLVFGDNDTATAGSWTLDNNAVSTNNLILAGTTPGISVNALGTGKTATISAIIQGADGLVKSGNGTLILSAANTYTGITNINSGILRIGNATSLGTQTGATDRTVIASGATLDLGGVGLGANNEFITVSGAGVGGNGAITSSSAIPTPFIGVRFLTMAGDTTLGFTNRWDVGNNTTGGTLTGGGFTLNLVGSGAAAQASLNGLGDTDLGDIIMNLGSGVNNIVYLQGNTTLGQAAKTVTISGGTTLNFFTNVTLSSYDKKFALNTGHITVSKAGTMALPGTISLAGTNIITANASNVAINASGVISGAGGLTKAGAGSLTLSNANTYTGTTSVTAGTLNLTGNRTATAGAISVSNGSTLGVSNGNFSIGNSNFFVGGTAGTSKVNHTAGTISTGTGGDQVLIGNGGFAGEYNLSGGTLSIGFTGTAGARGVMLGVNTGTGGGGTFNLSGTGHLNMTGTNSGLQIGRSDAVSNSTTNVFNQTGGTATIRYLRIGGNTGGSTGVNSTLSLTGGVFTAAIFDRLAFGGTNTAQIQIGGSADVTLPAFPTTALGSGSSATITFDGGVLKNLAASANYLGNISSAQIKNGGAKFHTAGGSITITHALNNFTGHNGTLTKEGGNALTLAAANGYSGLTTINTGTLALGAAGSIDNTSGVHLGGGTFDVSAKSGYTVNNLTGNGNVLGALTVSTSLAIGASPGQITFGNDLTLGAASDFNYEFTGGASAADLGAVSGNLTFSAGAALNLFQLGTYTLSDTFTLFAYDNALTGTFDGLAEGATATDNLGGLWRINYGEAAAGANFTGSTTGLSFVNITAIPEPSAALLGGLGSLLLLRRRRN